ncbi:MAG: acyl-CoA dehydrogenase family protein [Janthinobacterium lividum]
MRILERLGSDALAWRTRLEHAIDETSPLPRALQLDAQKQFDEQLYERLGQLGVFGLGTPSEVGGVGGNTVDQAVALETLGRHATSMAVVCVVSFLNTRMLRQYGTQAQRDRYLRDLLTGKQQAAFCLTESGGGTDVLSHTQTSAVRRTGGGWLLNGSKTWISGATSSDVMLVVARTDAHRSRGLTVFLVPSDTVGVSATRIETMLLNGYPTGTVNFENVELPETAILGAANEGLQQLMSALNGERINAAAVVNGVARGALDAALQHVREREAFGKPLGQFQAVQHRLAEVAVQTELAWLAVLEAAQRDAAGESTDIVSSLAKWSSSKAALRATDVGMEVMAASGVLQQAVMQRYFRDARLHVFAPINNDMVLNLLGERWLRLPRSF